MKGTIDFRYHAPNDVVVATPHWRLETTADAAEWLETYARYLKRFDRRMDLIIVLDDFDIAPAIATAWGEYRAKLHQNLTRHSIRVHASNRVRLFVNTSGARFDVATGEAATVEDAILAIKTLRQKAG